MLALGPAMLLLQVAANAQLGYRFTVPDGFVAFPEGRSQRDVVDCWAEERPASPDDELVLCVQRMRGTLSRERMKQEDVPSSARLQSFKWKGFDIDGLRTDTTQGGMSLVVLAAQVPLRGEAIQLILAGPQDQWQRAEAIMTSTLASLEGESNWLTPAERAGRLGNIVGWGLGIAIGVLLIRMWLTRQRSKAA